MNIYEVDYFEKELDVLANQNDGEIPEEKMQELIELQTKSIQQIEKLCRYIKHLEYFRDTARAEEARIHDLRLKSEKKLDQIKKYLIPFVEKRGRFDAGTFQLSVRHSESIQTDDDFFDRRFIEVKFSESIKKNELKQALKSGEEIAGARIEKRVNLVLK